MARPLGIAAGLDLSEQLAVIGHGGEVEWPVEPDAAEGAASEAPVGMLRLISLSPVDALLYGPIKLNWIVDLGLGLSVVVSALAYVRIVGSRR